MKQKVLLAAAVLAGILTAYVDSRPGWDDTGITAGLLFLTGSVVGLLVSSRPWLFALALGIWLPLAGVAFRHDFLMLVTLFIPFLGVYLGWGLRLLANRSGHSAG